MHMFFVVAWWDEREGCLSSSAGREGEAGVDKVGREGGSFVVIDEVGGRGGWRRGGTDRERVSPTADW
jgi:hypothetical protein